MRLVWLLLVTGLVSPANAETPDEKCELAAASKYETGHESTGVDRTKINAKEAIQACTGAIANGPASPQVLYRLSRAYSVDGNDVAAADLARKSAEAGYAPAEYQLGAYYDNAGDSASAVNWYKKAADQGFGLAEHDYAEFLASGRGVQKDLQLAKVYYLRAARDLRSVDPITAAHALNNLAFAEREGLNFSKSEEYFRQAADAYRPLAAAGDGDAIYHYGALELQGYGVPQNVQSGIAHLRQAAKMGVKSCAD